MEIEKTEKNYYVKIPMFQLIQSRIKNPVKE